MTNNKTMRKRDTQTIKFLKWIHRYNGWWHLICTPNDEHMDTAMMKMLITRLEQEEFYEIIFVLLMVHRKADFMESVNDLLLNKIITAIWSGEKTTIKQILNEYKSILT